MRSTGDNNELRVAAKYNNVCVCFLLEKDVKVNNLPLVKEVVVGRAIASLGT